MFTYLRTRPFGFWAILLLTLSLSALILLSSLSALPLPTERLELAAADLAIQLRGTRPTDGEIVIVAIDDAALNYTGYRWPWPRAYLAQIVDVLNQSGARLIGVDIFLFEPDDDPAGDAALARALTQARAAVSVMQISREGMVETVKLPLPEYQQAFDALGITGILYDNDAIVRSIQPYDYSQRNQRIYYNWALEVASLYLDTPLPKTPTPENFLFNGKRVPLMGARLPINFRGPAATFPTYSAHQVALGDYPPETFRDKIVLIGATSVTLQDIYPTPFSSRARTPGVEIVASAIHTVLHSEYILVVPPFANVLLVWLSAAACLLILRLRQPVRELLWMFAAILLYLLLWLTAFWGFNAQFSLILPLSVLFLGVMLPAAGQAVNEEREKRRVRALFSRFISPEMVRQLLETQDTSLLNKRAPLTILFSDIRGFTSLSEKLSPEDVVRLLNPYLAAMTDIIHKHGGTVDKYEGDAILAFFGEPIPHADHAERAVRAACEMYQALDGLRTQWRAQGLLTGTFEIGIGINTGEVFVGLLGSEQRVNYTVIGDDVNLAARLQDLTKTFNWPILISGKTYEQVKTAFDAEFLENRQVKGKTEAVAIYKVLGACDNPQQRIHALYEV
ncbi:MAG: adenylate/guanylate cyclase domain-containing protein [Anaerolineales bacterium]